MVTIKLTEYETALLIAHCEITAQYTDAQDPLIMIAKKIRSQIKIIDIKA